MATLSPLADSTATPDAPLEQHLPVLAEVPELGAALEALLAADRAVALALDLLVRLRRTGEAEAATGVGLDTWLGTVARRGGADRRMLLTAAATLERLPQLHRCVTAGELSWAQLRQVVLQLHDHPALSTCDLERLDADLAGAVAGARGLDPDALARTVRWILADLLLDHEPSPTTTPDERLVLQPRLDGSGGAVVGELGPVGFAALDAATRPSPGVPSPAAQRAARLTDLCLHATTARAAATADGDGGGPADRAEALDGVEVPVGPAADARSDVHLLLRVELETLLRLDDRPAQLLTSLAGGAMWTDAATARRLADGAGSLRLIVTEGGAPVGVGRRSRRVPERLREAMLALHDTCTAPGCRRPALTADADHARPWAEGGTTDLGNLAPLCAHHNRDARRRSWRVEQELDGTRTWSHARSGLQVTTRPDRPPPDRPRPDRPPPGARRTERSRPSRTTADGRAGPPPRAPAS